MHRELYSLSSISPVFKNLPANAGDAGDLGSVPGSGRSPGVGNGNPLQYKIPWTGELVGYSSRGHKELDVIERACTIL